MTTQQYLSQALQLDRRIRAKRVEIEHLRELARSVSVSPGEYTGGNGPGDPVGRGAAKIADLEAELQADIERYTKLHREISAVIVRVPDSRYVELLTRRYIRGQTWELIADEMYYSRKRIWELHKLALDEVSRLLNSG